MTECKKQTKTSKVKFQDVNKIPTLNKQKITKHAKPINEGKHAALRERRGESGTDIQAGKETNDPNKQFCLVSHDGVPKTVFQQIKK